MSAIVGKVKTQTCVITGTLEQTQNLEGWVSQTGTLVGDLATAYSTSGAEYEGTYEVTPTVGGLEMETKGKFMSDDVKIHAIPFFEVENTSGGNTVYIAGEIEME